MRDDKKKKNVKREKKTGSIQSIYDDGREDV